MCKRLVVQTVTGGPLFLFDNLSGMAPVETMSRTGQTSELIGNSDYYVVTSSPSTYSTTLPPYANRNAADG